MFCFCIFKNDPIFHYRRVWECGQGCTQNCWSKGLISDKVTAKVGEEEEAGPSSSWSLIGKVTPQMLSRLKAQKAKGCIKIEELYQQLPAGRDSIGEKVGRE